MNTETTLETAAKIAARDCLGLKKNEKVLIITNDGAEVAQIARAMYKASLDAGARPVLVVQETKDQTAFAEDAVIGAIASMPDVLISLSAGKLGKDKAALEKPYLASDGKKYDHIFHYALHGAKAMRAFWSPRATIDMFTRTVPIDYALMRSRACALGAILDQAESVHVSAPSGTDIFVGLRGRKAMYDDGDFSSPGSGGNLPAGEVFLSPALKSSVGTIVFDGSIANTLGDIVIKEPIRCTVAGGFIIAVEGGPEAAALEAALQRGMEAAGALSRSGSLDPETALMYATNARNIGELGIGLNPHAEIRGAMLEDEKVLGTCHFAIGSNYDEDAPAMIHLDGLVREPSIVARLPDGKLVTLMEQGTIVV